MGSHTRIHQLRIEIYDRMMKKPTAPNSLYTKLNPTDLSINISHDLKSLYIYTLSPALFISRTKAIILTNLSLSLFMNMDIGNIDEDECLVWSVSMERFASSMRPSLLPLSRFTFNFEFCLEVVTFDWPVVGLTWPPHPIAKDQQQPTRSYFGTLCVKDQCFSYYKALDDALARLPHLPVEERPDLVMFALEKAYNLFYGQQEIPEFTTFDFAFKLRLERDLLLFADDDDQLNSSPGVSSCESFV